jgi:HEAT repeat protein
MSATPSIKFLVASLDSRSANVRESSVKALSQMGDEAIIALLDAAFKEDSSLACEAAKALGEIGDHRVVIAILSKKPYPSSYDTHRQRAAEALQAFTGQDFGDDAKRWSEWWDSQKEEKDTTKQ